MGKILKPSEDQERLAPFRVYVGAPLADKRPPDLIGRCVANVELGARGREAVPNDAARLDCHTR